LTLWTSVAQSNKLLSFHSDWKTFWNTELWFTNSIHCGIRRESCWCL